MTPGPFFVGLRKKNEYTGDVTLQAGEDGDKVKVHKFILICRSKVFLSMFGREGPSKKNQ
jgi:hypothetical protein